MRASVLVACLFATTSAQAAGFAVAEQGAAAFGIAGAATARGDMPEAAFYNPAALTAHAGPVLTLGASAISAELAHQAPDGTRTDAITAVETPPYVHAAYGFGRGAVGVAFLAPFGSGLLWPSDNSWSGRFEITGISLRVFELMPSFALRITDELSIAASPRILWGTVAMRKQIDGVTAEPQVELGGGARGFGGQASVLARPFPEVSLGLTYRSRVRMSFNGNAHFDDVPVELSHLAHDSPVSTSLTLPDRIAFGAALEVGRYTFSTDAEYYLWSTVQSLDIDFADTSLKDEHQPRNWSNTLAVRLGVEAREVVRDLRIRAGVAFDPTPSPSDTLSPSLPDGDRLVASVGASYELMHGLALHASVGHVFFLGSTASGNAFAGSYDAEANVLALGVSITRN